MCPEHTAKRSIIEREIAFWDKWAADNESALEPAVPTVKDLADPFAYDSDLRFLERIGAVKGLRVLDLGSGLGALSLYLANEGAEVIGLDVSKGMVARSRTRSSKTNSGAEFLVADAEQLPFRSDCFHRVVGMRSIHHLPNLSVFFIETQRVLAPGGRAVFVEPQRCNPIVEINRKLLRPDKRTEDEHPLVTNDIKLAQSTFPNSTVETFYLISPIAYLFRFVIKNDDLFRLISTALQAVEKRLSRTRLLRPLCWQVIMTLTKNKESQGLTA